MSKKTIITLLVVILLLIFVGGAFGIFGIMMLFRADNNTNKPSNIGNDHPTTINQFPPDKFLTFQSDEEFIQYYTESQTVSSRNYLMPTATMDMSSEESKAISPTTDSMSNSFAVSGGEADRYSTTNVQVAGIDEPDIVKTDGQTIFYSHQSPYYYDFMKTSYDDEYMPSTASPSATLSINALPVDKISQLSSIEETGDLLLAGKYLMIIGYSTISAYDISKPDQPQKAWDIKTDNSTQIYQSRLLNDKLYLITSTGIYSQPSCPIPLLTNGQQEISIACTDIYHPSESIDIDSTYTVMQIDPASGKIANQISFLGSYDSTLYMSPDNIYIGYSQSGDYIQLFNQFLTEHDQIFSSDFSYKINRLNSYDLSRAAKMLEMETILSQYTATLGQDDRLKFNNDLNNAVSDFIAKHKRELSSTVINKISIADFSVVATGSIPGTLLNQFSLDEADDALRVATTTDQNWAMSMFSLPSSESVNDVYVLDNKLNITGSVLDLGQGERIYSVRFIGDKGYVVTFKETDPFYVLDLSDTAKPRRVGELKIPGYSSYLHPLSDNLILGIGREDSNVKLSLFDVSNPAQPKEVAKYSLTEYWSDVLNTHHAFMQDEKNQLFFIPGSAGGYIFSYADNTLSLSKTISSISAQRALFINNYLYIIGQDEIVIVDENSLERVNSLIL